MTSSEDDIIPGRKFALYECTGGDKPHTFESLKPKKKETSRTCRKHDTEAKRVEYRDLRKSVRLKSWLLCIAPFAIKAMLIQSQDCC